MGPPLEQVDRIFVRYRGRRLLYFAGCDYFRLASHPAVLAAARSGLRRFGLNVAASRITTGNHPLYAQLESALAHFFQADRAVVVATGYVANSVAAQALSSLVDHAFLDDAAHPSLTDAAATLPCPISLFRHADPTDLARQLQLAGSPQHPLVLTDGLFARTGTIAPLPGLLEQTPATGWLLVDDAHAAGILGASGRGTPEYWGLRSPRLIQTCTLSKAFGTFGGAILAHRSVTTRLLTLSHQFAGSTPLPLPLAAAALAALRLFRRSTRNRRQLEQNVRHAKDRLRSSRVALPDNPAPILSVLTPNPTATTRLKRALLAHGIYPSFIHYPGGPQTGFFRFTLSSLHLPAHIDTLVDTLLACPGITALPDR